MSAKDMLQSFFDEVLKPAITQAVTKADNTAEPRADRR